MWGLLPDPEKVLLPREITQDDDAYQWMDVKGMLVLYDPKLPEVRQALGIYCREWKQVYIEVLFVNILHTAEPVSVKSCLLFFLGVRIFEKERKKGPGNEEIEIHLRSWPVSRTLQEVTGWVKRTPQKVQSFEISNCYFHPTSRLSTDTERSKQVHLGLHPSAGIWQLR